MTVPPGFTVGLFAGEPMVVNPIAFTVDERGRLWVVECFEYPNRTPAGKMPRDRIVILEDTDGDGRADKRTVFCEGKDFPDRFDLASGIEVGHGGVFLGAPPYLWFIENKDDRPGKFEKRLSGFGSQDTHETLNTFQWGADGWLYGLHGIFTTSVVKSGADDPGIKMDAAVWRYHPRLARFEVVAEGTSNPWGWDRRNTDGQIILACCVIPHLYHIVPGGSYKRQAGSSKNPYAYGSIDEICDHTFHKESGWAHAGLISLDTPIMPAEFRDSVIFGSIHGSSLKRNTLRPKGSTYVASKAPDFLTSADRNVRPINLRWGPNGEIYLIDWHDQNPCHQALPDSWDYERGRVYRIVPPGITTGKARDLRNLPEDEQSRLISDPNPYIARTIERLRQEKAPTSASVPNNFDTAAGRLRAASELRVIRSTGPGKVSDDLAADLARLHELMSYRQDAADPKIPLMLWWAYEPRMMRMPEAEFAWLRANADGNPLITDHILPRATRRLAASNSPETLGRAVAFVASLEGFGRVRALEGLAAAVENRTVDAPPGWNELVAVVEKDPAAQPALKKLRVSFRDRAAGERALRVVRDAARPPTERIDALPAAAALRSAEAADAFLQVVRSDGDLALRRAAARALGELDAKDIPQTLFENWPVLPSAVRSEAVSVLAGRKEWAKALIGAIEGQRIPASDLNTSVALRIHAFKDKELTASLDRVWGPIREASSDMTALIDEKRKLLQSGAASMTRGKKVFTEHCGKCHQFEGVGHNVGPALDGAARDIEYLLANILDPNRVIGAPYQLRRVILSNGRIEEGLLVSEDATGVTIRQENDQTRVIPRSEIDELQVSEKSVMPEGLAKPLSDADFRDLIRYAMAHPFVTEWAVGDKRISAPVTGVWDLPANVPARATFTAGQPVRTRLIVTSSARVRVTIDGIPIHEGGPGEQSIEVKLDAGERRLTLESATRRYPSGSSTPTVDSVTRNRKSRAARGQTKCTFLWCSANRSGATCMPQSSHGGCLA
jgi:putative membrane-bound dehydrogenase-like protein